MRKRPVFWISLIALVMVGTLVMILPRPEMRVKRTTEPSAELKRAISEARSRLPEFSRALANAKPGDQFAVRARFTTPVGNEYLWVKDPLPSSKGFIGLIDQQPAFLKKAKGELVLIPRDDIVDWMAKTESGLVGNFTKNLE